MSKNKYGNINKNIPRKLNSLRNAEKQTYNSNAQDCMQQFNYEIILQRKLIAKHGTAHFTQHNCVQFHTNSQAGFNVLPSSGYIS